MFASTLLALLALLAMPASAAEFYIVQDIAKQTCTITRAPPKDDAHTVVGDGAYDDEATAASDMRKMLATTGFVRAWLKLWRTCTFFGSCHRFISSSAAMTLNVTALV